ncbi:MAG: transposase [Rickettsia hoogstraalii]
MTHYSRKSHTVYYHRYHIVWITKYRYKVLTYDIKRGFEKLLHR